MINIEISENNKEESAKKHQKMISKFQKNQHDDRIIIYTDRSKSETNQIGAGLVSPPISAAINGKLGI